MPAPTFCKSKSERTTSARALVFGNSCDASPPASRPHDRALHRPGRDCAALVRKPAHGPHAVARDRDGPRPRPGLRRRPAAAARGRAVELRRGRAYPRGPADRGAGRGEAEAAVVPAAAGGVGRPGPDDGRHGRGLRGAWSLALRAGRLQLRRPRRRQHAGAGEARHRGRRRRAGCSRSSTAASDRRS